MSKFVSSIIIVFGILLILVFGTLTFNDLNYGIISFDWSPYKKLFGEFDRKGTWIRVEKGLGSYGADLDKKWVLSIFRDLKVSINWRDSFSDDNNDMLDLIYEMKAKLTRPIYSDFTDRKVNYTVNIFVKFIDEEGFVLESIFLRGSDYFHEEFERTSLFHEWDGPENEDVTVKGQLKNILTKKIAKRAVRIIYKPVISLRY